MNNFSKKYYLKFDFDRLLVKKINAKCFTQKMEKLKR